MKEINRNSGPVSIEFLDDPQIEPERVLRFQ